MSIMKCIMRSLIIIAFLPSVIRMIKLRWAERVPRMGNTNNAYIILAGNLKRRNLFGDISVDGG
jgi:hypothetical protein